jgi:hypothetical protein
MGWLSGRSVAPDQEEGRVIEARRALSDILAGAIFILLGVAFGVGALAYDMGEAFRPGPGYFPLALGIMQVALGILVIVKGFIAGDGEPFGAVEWRSAAFITAAVIFFGLTIRGLGVVGALFGASLLSALARSRTTWREALLTAAGLTVLSVVIFIVALQLRLPLIGTWF